jgi:hypothetical protein
MNSKEVNKRKKLRLLIKMHCTIKKIKWENW